MNSRETFTTSRELEFFSKSELRAQIGYEPSQWAIALLKELIDNALDACEMAGKSPALRFDIDQDCFTVADNGPGLPESVLNASLDYGARVSDKQGYISPSRGQQGNALKTLWAAPLVLDGEKGAVTVITADYAYRVELVIDLIAQVVSHTLNPISERVDEGTTIKVHSEKMVEQLEQTFQDLLVRFALFNPHASVSLGDGEDLQLAPVEGFKKWTPSLPTSPHWYDVDSLDKLASRLLDNSRKRRSPMRIREFVQQFDGLKRTSKQKTIGEAMEPDTTLEDLTNGNGFDKPKLRRLLSLMKEDSTPIKPGKLGSLGKDFLFNYLTAFNCKMEGFKYKKIELDDPANPCIVEAAIAYHTNPNRLVFWGLNFTPIPKPLPWDISYYLDDDDVLIDDDDPIVLVIHITTPKFSFTDRGKSALSIPYAVKAGIKECLEYIAKDWAKIKRKKKRSEQTTLKELESVVKAKDKKVTVKDAAYQVMEQSYMQASENNRYPANARQIMYQARPFILELTGKDKLDDKYFTTDLLPGYINDNPETTANWDVIYDARGDLIEPHTGNKVRLGTLGVRHYLNGWKKDFSSSLCMEGIKLGEPSNITTMGCYNRYKFALFIEKQGFEQQLDKACIASRYDIAIFSTKGVSNVASRQLVESLSLNGVTILVAHDFDKAGFTIFRTLGANNDRYQFGESPNLIDIGLRLTDVEAMDLGTETVTYKSDPIPELERCGCSPDEINFLCSHKTSSYSGQRVELNAMTSGRFIVWLEEKLKQHGVTKFVPDEDKLVEAYRLQVKRQKFNTFLKQNVEESIKEEIDRLEALDIAIPDKLAIAVQDQLKAKPLIPWDKAIDQVAEQFVKSEQETLAS